MEATEKTVHVDEKAAAALGVNFQFMLDPKGLRTVIFQTHVAADVPEDKLNALLDKIVRVTSRQVKLTKIDDLKVEIEMLEKQIYLHTTDLAVLYEKSSQAWIASEKRGAWDKDKMSVTEQSNEHNLHVSINGLKERLTASLKQIEELTATVLLNGSGDHAHIHGAADRNAGLSDR